jgi:hypothetical protein
VPHVLFFDLRARETLQSGIARLNKRNARHGHADAAKRSTVQEIVTMPCHGFVQVSSGDIGNTPMRAVCCSVVSESTNSKEKVKYGDLRI